MRRNFVGLSAVFGAMLAIASGNPASAQPAGGAPTPSAVPWMNASLTADERADLLAGQLSQEEELTLVKGYFGAKLKLTFIKPSPAELQPILPGTAGYVPGIPRLGIPPLIESDAGEGIANSMHMRPGDTATALPSTLLSAATWNPALAFLAGRAIGTEARDRGFNVVLDGSLNLAREPRGGRTFEYAGEDPLLAGTIAGETIRGIESVHVISTMKHVALNDQETGRGVLSANLPEAAMRESDLLAFEIALEHGSPGAVMCSYNRVNSTYACENDFLLNRVLKQDWGFPGWVLSDWGGVHSTVAAANSGLDQESASNFDAKEFFGAPLKQAIADGSVKPERLHEMVHRILRSMFTNGLFDDPPAKAPPPVADDRAQAQREAEDGIVLLKDANGILPLAKSARSIALIGAHADVGMLSGGGSSQVVPLDDDPDKEFPVGGPVIILPNGAPILPTGRHIYDPPSPLAAIAAAAPHARVRYDAGANLEASAKLASRSEIAVVFVQQWMTEGQDVKNLSLPGAQDALIEAVAAANPRTIVVLETGGPVLMPWLEKVPAVVEAWYAGNGGAPALARILFGDVNPSGRLPITFPQSESQLPHPELPNSAGKKGWFDVDYTEGANIGYRWFELQKTAPLFPFGFGLSYTNFRVSGLQATAGDTLDATADVTNLGAREGSETVQLYATPPAPGAVSRLVGWTKVSLKPGETQHVAIAVDPRLLAHFDTDGRSWLIDAGAYTLAAGTSSTDASTTIAVTLAERRIKP